MGGKSGGFADCGAPGAPEGCGGAVGRYQTRTERCGAGEMMGQGGQRQAGRGNNLPKVTLWQWWGCSGYWTSLAG